MTLQERWQGIAEKFDALETRERLLVLVGGALLIIMLLDFMIVSPVAKQLSKKEASIVSIKKELQVSQQTLTQMVQLQSFDPNGKLRESIAVEQKKVDRLDEQLAQMSVGLIRADELPQLLEQLLLESKGLRLTELQTLPVQLITLSGTEELLAQTSETGAPTEPTVVSPVADPAWESSASQPVGVYKHRVRVEFEGSYFDVTRYLRRLEHLSWRFYWDRMTYEVDDYPSGRVTVWVYTLTTEEGLLGV
ncbi:type II secretion system protein GspM [Marinibactrum halimedae]|uniref:MSHA biogenesis protein MshJ n=1 Tax=Marinibactrum halimedae TaxID=1444977 RepID=A0AA37T6J1_9GAMM|nr:type II secretion system protein GspM [Marinibactrum halimedae]MCD9460826.1 type II secretion system protein GspM [Marinibactrum halimedae]GLS26709.1 MSHA biogenesis protein MshJ [Marinibactrum halimedae]